MLTLGNDKIPVLNRDCTKYCFSRDLSHQQCCVKALTVSRKKAEFRGTISSDCNCSVLRSLSAVSLLEEGESVWAYPCIDRLKVGLTAGYIRTVCVEQEAA